jgi:hypothetical protein
MSAGGVLIVHARRLLSQEQRHGNNPHRPLLAAASAGDDLACRKMEEGACIPPPHKNQPVVKDMSNDATLDVGRLATRVRNS